MQLRNTRETLIIRERELVLDVMRLCLMLFPFFYPHIKLRTGKRRTRPQQKVTLPQRCQTPPSRIQS